MNSQLKPNRIKFLHLMFWFFLIIVGVKVAAFGVIMMMGLLPHEVLIAFVTKLWTLGPTFLINGLICSSVGFVMVTLCVWQLMRLSANCEKRNYEQQRLFEQQRFNEQNSES